MRTDESNNKHLIAEDGKVFRRISDGWIAGPEIYLGKTYHLGGDRLDTPLEELPGHYGEESGDDDEIIRNQHIITIKGSEV